MPNSKMSSRKFQLIILVLCRVFHKKDFFCSFTSRFIFWIRIVSSSSLEFCCYLQLLNWSDDFWNDFFEFEYIPGKCFHFVFLQNGKFKENHYQADIQTMKDFALKITTWNHGIWNWTIVLKVVFKTKKNKVLRNH